MPHSGGGGSHSGGGGGHSGGSGGSSTRVSSTPFHGSHTYVVYNNNGSSRLVYSNSKDYHAETTKGAFITSTVIAGLFFVLPGFIACITGLVALFGIVGFGMKPTKYPSKTDDTVYIYDDYDYITDAQEQELIETLEDFRNKTGVIPSVEVTQDDYWMRNYTSMENFAYDEYVSRFDDEYHLLIVYSFGYEDTSTGFNEFHWHVMWGDDLGKTINSGDEKDFGDELQKEFTRANGKEIHIAIENSVNALYDKISNAKIHFNSDNASVGLIMPLWGIFFAGAGLSSILSMGKKYKSSKENGERTYKISGTPQIRECKYCSCTYYAGTIGTCIHCGAPLSAE